MADTGLSQHSEHPELREHEVPPTPDSTPCHPESSAILNLAHLGSRGFARPPGPFASEGTRSTPRTTTAVDQRGGSLAGFGPLNPKGRRRARGTALSSSPSEGVPQSYWNDDLILGHIGGSGSAGTTSRRQVFTERADCLPYRRGNVPTIGKHFSTREERSSKARSAGASSTSPSVPSPLDPQTSSTPR
jgi:hypothetical protein